MESTKRAPLPSGRQTKRPASTSGREAYRRLHVFVGTPKQFQDCEKEKPAEACRKITGKYTTLGAVSKFLGSNVR